MTRIEEQLADDLADALAARASAVDPLSVRPLVVAEATGGYRGQRRWWLAPVAAAASVAVVAVVAAVAHQALTVHQAGSAPGLPLAGRLWGVDALSARDVWAVGYVERPANERFAPLIVHWDGQQWQRLTVPALPGGGRLAAVTGLSADDVWAVGTSAEPPATSLILHWNGERWSLARIAAARDPGQLFGVSADSATDAWAVGSGRSGFGAFILHWNGTDWIKMPVPASVPADLTLRGVLALSARDVWAAGFTQPRHGNTASMILHWNGRTWTVVPSPDVQYLWDVIPGPAGGIWAVGTSGQSILRWHDGQWRTVPGPKLAAGDWLYAIAPISARSTWAVGAQVDQVNGKMLVLHWNGSRWSRVTHPGPREPGGLLNLSAVSADDIWAAGFIGTGAGSTPVVLHWNGTSWTQAYGSATTGGLLQNSSCGPFQRCSGPGTPAGRS